MKSMNKKEGKKIAVMAAVIVGLMMFAFMPMASAGVTSFTVTPSTGYAGAVDSYDTLVTTDGVTSIYIPIAGGFLAVEPVSGGVQIARADFWNSSTKAYYGYATITVNNTDPAKVDVYCKFGNDVASSTQDVDYTAGATNTFESGFASCTSTVIIKLPEEAQKGCINLTINCADFKLDDVMIAIGQFVRNPTTAGTYTFYAEDEPATVTIKATGDYGSGVYRNGRWFLRTEDSPYATVYRVGWGRATDIPVTGDWNGDGIDTIGLYRAGEWILSDSITTPSRDYDVWWGRATDIPVTGDWNGDGIDTIGLYRDGEWIFSNSIDTPSRDQTTWWGLATDIPVTGDWNGGTDSIGLYRAGEWILSNSITTPSRDYDFLWGLSTDIPVTGDWNDDGTDSIGLYRDGEWIFSNSIDTPSRDHTAWWGLATDIPVTGDWI